MQWMVLVSVDTAESYGLTIDGNKSVFEFHSAKADSLSHG
jgi:hypothetical protein